MTLKTRFCSTLLVFLLAVTLSAEDYSITDYGAEPNSDADISTALLEAIEAAGQDPDNRVVIPEGTYHLAKTVKVPNGFHVKLVGEGDVNILTGPDMEGVKGFQSRFPYKTAIVIAGDNTDQSPFPKQVVLKNLKFQYDGDADSRSAVIGAKCYLDSLVIEDCKFDGYTHAGTFGTIYLTEGSHPGSDAHTMIKSLLCKGNVVVSDDKPTGQNPKSFHFHCPTNAKIVDNRFWGKGNGYVFRINGGGFDTIPTPGQGSYNIEFANNYVRSDTSHHEYGQMTKSSGIKIHDNEAYSSTKGAHNFMDLFNCRDVEFYNNKATGGGLCFFGHADLGHGKYSKKLVGSQNFHAWDNTITNPAHNSVFNIGGDGTVGGNRASHDILIERTTVIVEPGHDASRVALVYSFISNDLEIRDNDVRGIGRFVRSYYDRGYNIHDNYIEDVPTLVSFENPPGDDWMTRKTHKFDNNELVGTSGSITGFERLKGTK